MNRSENMRAIRGKNSIPEMVVRSLVHGLGYRFRLHRAELPGKPDLVFPARCKVIFVHGCFWHSHACKGGLVPKSNRDFWLPKLRQNKERDSKNIYALTQLGWSALVIWQCELKDINAVRVRVKEFLGSANRAQSTARCPLPSMRKHPETCSQYQIS
jgi:DNA mismatch endonuclease (patch repair protein)